MTKINKQVQLEQQPEGTPNEKDFRVVETEIPSPKDGEFLAKNLFLSLDPYMRGAIAGKHMGHSRLNQGDLIGGRCVSEIIESNNSTYKVGDRIVIESGWQEYVLSSGQKEHGIRIINKSKSSLSASLGVLGMPGLTSWAGVECLSKPTLGETFVVTAAAGPVGGTAGQLAKLKGAHVVGVAGSKEKCIVATDKYGFDACINYNDANWLDNLSKECPKGIDVYFDNVGGLVLDQISDQLNLYGRIILCGFVSQYNNKEWHGHNLGKYVGKRANLLSVVVYDYYNRFDEFLNVAIPLVESGRMKYKEDRDVGIDSAPKHFSKLMAGKNVGKAVVEFG